MLSRISQFKQSLSDEFEQAVSPQRPLNDPVSIIERNAQVLRTETPELKDIMIESDVEDSAREHEAADLAANDKPTEKNGAPAAAPRAEQSSKSQSPTALSDSAIDAGAPQKLDAIDPQADHEPGARNDVAGHSSSNGDARDVRDSSGRSAASGSDTENAPNSGVQDKLKSESEKPVPSDVNTPADATSKIATNTNSPSRLSSEAPSISDAPGSEATADEPQSQNAPSNPQQNSAAKSPVDPARTSSEESRRSADSERPGSKNATPVAEPASSDPVLAAKLIKFEKYEQKYPGLLKAYKTEKKKNDLVRIYEKVLSEHTPCTSIAEPQELVNYLKGLSSRSELQQKEIGKLNSEVAALKSELASEKRAVAELKQDLDKTKQRADAQLADARAQAQAQATAQLKSDETAKLKEKVTALEQQLADSEAAGSVAARTQTTLRTQLDELGLRLAETQTELEVVRDELVDTERQGQERLQELSSVRQALRSRDKDRRRSVDEAASQIAVLTSEKEQLEAEIEVLGRRIVRETEQLHVQLRSVRSQLRDSEAHAAELQQELDQQLSRQESTAAPRVPSQKPAAEATDSTEGRVEVAQAQAEAAVSGAVKANELLKQVNADNALRIEKLLKAQRALTADLEQLRSENQQLRRRTSVSYVEGHSFDSEKQKAYLRNVLLGFIEHRDQRKMLLPVLATLLGFQEGEEEILLNNVK